MVGWNFPWFQGGREAGCKYQQWGGIGNVYSMSKHSRKSGGRGWGWEWGGTAAVTAAVTAGTVTTGAGWATTGSGICPETCAKGDCRGMHGNEVCRITGSRAYSSQTYQTDSDGDQANQPDHHRCLLATPINTDASAVTCLGATAPNAHELDRMHTSQSNRGTHPRHGTLNSLGSVENFEATRTTRSARWLGGQFRPFIRSKCGWIEHGAFARGRSVSCLAAKFRFACAVRDLTVTAPVAHWQPGRSAAALALRTGSGGPLSGGYRR